jgi:pimeloyl-ACP methyl ester carboxylesterase
VIQTIQTPDGRALEVHEEGDPSGLPVIVHHGTPMAGLHYAPHVELAREQGIRLIGYDRPGYGGSARHRGRTVSDCVADVHAIADALGLERFASWGISGGGPHVLACAALCDARLTAVASLASVAPYGAEGLDWLAGMGEDNLIEFGKALEGEAALRPLTEEHAAAARDHGVDELVEAMRTLIGEADRAVLTGRFAEYFLACERHAFESGADGWIDDDLAFTLPWGFELTEIRVPVFLWQGSADLMVPFAHGQWLAARIPGVTAHLLDGEGHLSIAAGSIGSLLDELVTTL